jgi:macrolide transport system ATP-binding/permease protein
MRRLRAWLLRCAGLFRKEQQRREFAEEIESHLRAHVEDNLRSGMSVEQARRQALIKLGGMQQLKENYQQRRSLPMLETLWSDMRFGCGCCARIWDLRRSRW